MKNVLCGVDVGGTNTDAVVLNQHGEVIAAVKVRTTREVSDGVVNALQLALEKAKQDPEGVLRCCIGTTHFVNAIVSRSPAELSRVFCLRLGGTQSACLPPFCLLPVALTSVISGNFALVRGGHRVTGEEHEQLDEEHIRRAVSDALKCGIRDFAVTSPFSTQSPEHEVRAEIIVHAVAAAELGTSSAVRVSLSHQVGGANLIKRENAAILNASLRPLAERMTATLEARLRATVSLRCPIFLTQNDGTVLSLELTRLYPALTFGSGPTNSMRGAAYICGQQFTECIVCDIGGTTADVGLLLQNGFPKMSNVDVHVGGALVNSRIPEVASAAVGGGSHVSCSGDVGPVSVGYRLTEPTAGARVFGGPQLTATDVACRLGWAEVEGASKDSLNDIDLQFAQKVSKHIHDYIQALIDDAKTSSDDIPLILAGGGACLVSPDAAFEGISFVSRPRFAPVANAIGAALAQASAEIEVVVNFDDTPRDVAVQQAKQAVHDALNDAGAIDVKIVNESVVRIGFVRESLYRITIRGIGSFRETQALQPERVNALCDGVFHAERRPLEPCEASSDTPEEDVRTPEASGLISIGPAEVVTVPKDYKRHVDGIIWYVSEFDLECISIGAGILGCGGGGNTLFGLARARQKLRSGKQIKIVAVDSLDEHSVVVPAGFMGAPAIAIEMLGSGREAADAALAIGRASTHLQHHSPTHIGCVEIGGTNALEPLSAAAELGLAVPDCDAMGRAFPTLLQYLPWILGKKVNPVALTSCWNSDPVVLYSKETNDGRWCASVKGGANSPVEMYQKLLNVLMQDMSGICGIGLPSLNGPDIMSTFAQQSYTRAFNLGLAVLNARQNHTDCVSAVVSFEAGGRLLFKGNTGRAEPFFEGSPWDCATCELRGVEEYADQSRTLGIQNEYICLRDEERGLLASAPELIILLDRDTARPIFSDEVKTGYGLRVAVVGLPVPHVWTQNPEAMKAVGLEMFAFNAQGYPQMPESVNV